jgi:hypothetical protein
MHAMAPPEMLNFAWDGLKNSVNEAAAWAIFSWARSEDDDRGIFESEE